MLVDWEKILQTVQFVVEKSSFYRTTMEKISSILSKVAETNVDFRHSIINCTQWLSPNDDPVHIHL